MLSLSVGSGYSESYSYDSLKRVQSVTRTIEGRNYTTSYQMNTANQLTQITYPSNRVINVGHDNKGRTTSVGSYLSSVTYNGIGQMTGTTLGNGVTEGYGYDANRMQLTSQTATKSGGPTNGLMNLTYGYNAAAGQMGAGSTAGNAGQLMSISGTIGAVTESAAYTYDNLSRLVTSNQASNGSTAQRRFGLDRWANRTGMWDAVSGGNQIQSITLQQSGGAPTNRITSVTSGSTLNYLYDTAGDVTNDGVHNYTYDSENRIVSVDGGSTATYAYDHQNRRYKKTIGSTVDHYVWEGAQQLARHNGSTGAVAVDYVYYGSRMIAKESGATQYFLSDRLSMRVSLDSSGNVTGRQGHLPFGEDFAESGIQQRHHFTSYERDVESGTDYALNRHYSQSVGRFVSVDRVKGRTNNAQSWNRYSYVHNDAINLIDGTGLLEQRVDGKHEAYLEVAGEVEPAELEGLDTPSSPLETRPRQVTNGSAPNSAAVLIVRLRVRARTVSPFHLFGFCCPFFWGVSTGFGFYRTNKVKVPFLFYKTVVNKVVPSLSAIWVHCVSDPALIPNPTCFVIFQNPGSNMRISWTFI